MYTVVNPMKQSPLRNKELLTHSKTYTMFYGTTRSFSSTFSEQYLVYTFHLSVCCMLIPCPFHMTTEAIIAEGTFLATLSLRNC